MSACILHPRYKLVNRPISWPWDIDDYGYSVRRPTAILNVQNIACLSVDHSRNWNLHLSTKYDRNRMIRIWDMDIKLFSKWRLSAILSLRKLPCRFGHVIYMHVFLHLQSTFLLIGQYGAEIQPKTIFNMASVRHLEFAKFRLLCQITILGMDIVICIPNLIEIG